jgi:hypothetical protein
MRPQAHPHSQADNRVPDHYHVSLRRPGNPQERGGVRSQRASANVARAPVAGRAAHRLLIQRREADRERSERHYIAADAEPDQLPDRGRSRCDRQTHAVTAGARPTKIAATLTQNHSPSGTPGSTSTLAAVRSRALTVGSTARSRPTRFGNLRVKYNATHGENLRPGMAG